MVAQTSRFKHALDFGLVIVTITLSASRELELTRVPSPERIDGRSRVMAKAARRIKSAANYSPD
jgi:hypothetical protein